MYVHLKFEEQEFKLIISKSPRSQFKRSFIHERAILQYIGFKESAVEALAPGTTFGYTLKAYTI